MAVEAWDPFHDPAEDDGPVEPLFSQKLDVPPPRLDAYVPLVRQPRVIPAGARCVVAPKAAEGRPVRVLCVHDHVSSGDTLSWFFLQPLYLVIDREDLETKFVNGTISPMDHTSGEGRVMVEHLKEFKMSGLWYNAGMFDHATALIEEIDGEKMRVYEGMDAAIANIEEALWRHRPVDALLGFGAGSDLATVVAARAAAGMCEPIRCVIHACSNRPGWVRSMPELFGQKNHIPAFVLYGEEDPWAQGSHEVAALYHNPEVYSHPDGHQIFPTTTKNGKNLESQNLAKSMRDFILHYARND